MKFFRILPEMCARTRCLLSSSTRNIALGKGSITVAITSIASSLGKRFTFLRCDGDQSFFLINAVDDRENLFRDFFDRPHAVHLVIDAKLVVVLHQRMCFFFICPEPLLYQIFTVVGTLEQAPAANITHTLDAWGAAERVIDFAAAWTYQSSCKSCCQTRGVRCNVNHEQLIAVSDQFPERLRLLDCAWIAVENESFLAI